MGIYKIKKVKDEIANPEEKLEQIKSVVKKAFINVIEQNINLKAKTKKELADKLINLLEDKINELHVEDYEIKCFPDMRGPYIIKATLYFVFLDGKYVNHATEFVITTLVPIGFKKEGINFMIDQFAVKVNGQVKDVEDINNYYKDSKQIKDNNYGWEINSDDAYNAAIEYANEVGVEQAYEDLIRAMSYDELAANLEYIFRMNDFNSKYLK